MGEVLWVFLRLGLTCFGGPVAHLAYFRKAFVLDRRWLDEESYAGIVGFCQFLPGPASSQVAMVLGHRRAGFAGLIAAWLGFTLPSALLMILFALLVRHDVADMPWLHGLKLAAVAVVADAVWVMARRLTPDLPRIALAAGAVILVLLLPMTAGQLAAIVAGALLGALILNAAPQAPAQAVMVRRAWLWLALFLALLAVLPLLAPWNPWLAQAAAFYRSGALVFGGGHVVLPLLQQAVVAPGWLDGATFMAGYGAAQAMPGPLFSYAAFLGAAMAPGHPWSTALWCLCAIYLPSLLLVAGGWPLWQAVVHHPRLKAGLAGINAAVVGLLAAALWSPVITSAVFSPADGAIALAALALLRLAVPAWAVVGLCAAVAGLAAPWLH
jgi:chromate transporter